MDGVSRALGALFWATSTPEQRTRLGIALHDALEHSTAHATRGLFDWEEAWFRESLPTPPARVLVGGAGSGREVLALLDRGYEVDAFEPAERAFAALQRTTAGRARAWRTTYQELARHRGPVAHPYDAVLLGWGSLACLVDEDERIAALRELDRLCPDGPILASFSVKRAGLQRRRADQLVAHLGTLLGTAWARMPDEVVLVPSGGFMRPLDRSAVEALAQAIGRRASYHDAIGQAYVTWTR